MFHSDDRLMILPSSQRARLLARSYRAPLRPHRAIVSSRLLRAQASAADVELSNGPVILVCPGLRPFEPLS